MNQQRGYINLDGFFAVFGFLAVCGALGLVSFVVWGMPAIWQWLKPLIHAATG